MCAALPSLTRRDALKAGALAALGFPFAGSLPALADAPAAPRDRTHGIKLGIASYSFTSLTVDQAIPIIVDLGIRTVSVAGVHAPWAKGSVEECRAVVRKFADAGIEATSTGVIDLPNDEAVVRKAFENVRGAGLSKMAGRPAPAAFPLVEKFARDTDVRVAVHNHGTGDLYPTVADAIRAIRPYDARIGLCIDVGHSWQAGEDPAAAIRAFPERLYEVHLWDTRATNDGKTPHPVQVALGHGIVNIRAIVDALVEVGYSHEAELEYYERVKDKVLGVAESIGYLRGMLAT
jgi:sugar phosphate isomerase/epimerase